VNHQDKILTGQLQDKFKPYSIYLAGMSVFELYSSGKVSSFYIVTNAEPTYLYKNFENIFPLHFPPFDYYLLFQGIRIYIRIFHHIFNDSRQYLKDFSLENHHPLLFPLFYDFGNEVYYDFYDLLKLYKKNETKKLFSLFSGKKVYKENSVWEIYFFNRYSLSQCLPEFHTEKNEVSDYSYEKWIKKIPEPDYYFQLFESLSDEERFSFFYFLLIDRFNYYYLLVMDNSGILKSILPELYNLKNVYQNKEYHPEGDAFDHSMAVMKYLHSDDFIFLLGSLLHDIGKYETNSMKNIDKMYRFPFHSKVGAKVALKIIDRWENYLDFLPNYRERLNYFIANHMSISFIDKMDPKESKEIYSDADITSLVKLFKADVLSGMNPLHQYKKVLTFLRKNGVKL